MRIQRIDIDVFRGINNAKLNEFSRVNYIVGGNNSGKTSVLAHWYRVSMWSI